MSVIIDEKYGKLMHHPQTNIIHHRLYRSINGSQMRKLLDRGVEELKKHRSSKWMSDNREIMAVSEEDTQWINNNWLPRAVKEGWKYWALVVPHDTMARINMTEFVNEFYDKGIRIMVFTDPDEAMTWLEGVDKQ